MAFLNNPAVNHFVHLTILGALLFFSFVTLAISAGFIAKGKHIYFGKSLDCSTFAEGGTFVTVPGLMSHAMTQVTTTMLLV